MDIDAIKEILRQVIREEVKEMELNYPKFIPVDVPVPKFTEYKVSIPVIEERVVVLNKPTYGQG